MFWRHAERTLDHRKQRRLIAHRINRRSRSNGIARVVALVLQLPLAELSPSRVPGELRKANLDVGVAVGAAIVAADVVADFGIEVGFCRIG